MNNPRPTSLSPYRDAALVKPVCAQCKHSKAPRSEFVIDDPQRWMCRSKPTLLLAAYADHVTGLHYEDLWRFDACTAKNLQGDCTEFEQRPPDLWQRLAAWLRSFKSEAKS